MPEFAVPSCRLLIRGANTAKTHASRPVLAEQVFASHFRIDTKAIHGVEIIVCAGVAKAQHHIPDEALIRLVGHFKTRTHEIVHDHIVGVVAEASRDSHLGSAAHSIDGEAHIKRTAVGVLFRLSPLAVRISLLSHEYPHPALMLLEGRRCFSYSIWFNSERVPIVFLSVLPSVKPSALLSVKPSAFLVTAGEKLVRLTHNSSVAEAHAANFATDFEFIRFICLYVYTKKIIVNIRAQRYKKNTENHFNALKNPLQYVKKKRKSVNGCINV